MRIKTSLLNSAAVLPLAQATHKEILREQEAEEAFHWHLKREAKKVDQHKRSALRQHIVDGVEDTDWDEVIESYRRARA